MNKTMRKLQLLFIILLSSSVALAQQQTVSGKVIDATGVGIPGVSILVKGTSSGTVTDIDGAYSLNLPEGAETLIFSSIGYVSQEVLINSRAVIDINLQDDITSLEEIVVVGYGTQQKVNVTGSVETVDASEIARQPVFQTSQALSGLVPGLTAIQSSGQPGSDNAQLRIRGIGTLGSSSKNNPLILVDGIPDDLNGVDPNDIESISVLKDASAASIYGSRAANGLILVTTKRGKSGQVKVSYNNYFGVQRITEALDVVDGRTYIDTRNYVSPGYYSDETVGLYRANQGTDEFPDTDWVSEFFSRDGFQQYHNLSLSGGTDKAKVAASFSYQEQNGNAPNFNFGRISGRLNTDLELSKKLNLAVDLNFRKSLQESPSAGLGALTTSGIYRTQPIFDFKNDDGTWSSGWSGNNPIARAVDGGLTDNNNYYFRGVFKLDYRPIEDLSIVFSYSPTINVTNRKSFSRQYDWIDLTHPGLRSRQSGQTGSYPTAGASLSQSNQNAVQNNLNFVVTYQKSFSKHNFGVVLGYEQFSYNWSHFGAERIGYDVQEYEQLDAGDPDQQFNNGRETLWGLMSGFGRINYNYDERYLFEANLRADASSRIAEENRTTFLPSFSVGWRVSEEAFFPDNNILTTLKLRGSWGQLGNQGALTNFPYTALIDLSASTPIIGGTPRLGGAQTRMANRDVKWETTETTNIALDAEFFRSRLSLTAEVYTRITRDILLNVTIPTSTGLWPPTQNAGNVENKGYDLAFAWNDDIGEFNYGVKFNFSDYQNTITDLNGLNELPPSDDQINRLNESINSIYGLNVLRFYTEDDFNPDGSLKDGIPSSFSTVRPGDYLYEDIDGNNIINDDDRQIIGSPLPRMNWGLDLFANYKGFDLSIAFLGVGKREVPLKRFIGYPLINESAWATLFEWHLEDYWTPEKLDARFSRFEGGLNRINNFRVNSRYVFDASYLRVRNITLGYTLPKGVLSKIRISSLRFYVSGQNLFTSKKLPHGIDPLIPDNTSGSFYPVTAVFTGGLNLNF